jgi:hypothetical protein
VWESWPRRPTRGRRSSTSAWPGCAGRPRPSPRRRALRRRSSSERRRQPGSSATISARARSKAAIELTQAQLQRAIGDLGEQSGLIARNAEELAALKRTGLRDYFEFDLAKGKTPSPVGPVALRLKDADAKRHKFNMVLVVDDMEIEKKDKTLLEPVQFYRKGSRQLNEVVVYAVQKNRITGYLSAPKAGDTAATQ